MSKYHAICFVDVDGVMCRGATYTGTEIHRTFLPEDGHAVQLLKESGIFVVMLSGEDDKCIYQRAEKLSVPFIPTKDKLKTALQYIGNLSWNPQWSAFIGNDIPDIPLLKFVDKPAAPHDAIYEVEQTVVNEIGYICRNNGGEKCFREFADFLNQS